MAATQIPGSFRDNYKKNGFAIIENFLSQDEIETAKQEVCKIIENQLGGLDDSKADTSFDTPMDEDFLESADKIKIFHEKNARAKDGSLIVPKIQSVAKIGHALHKLNSYFHDLTTKPLMKQAFKEMDFEKPVVTQSMLILKNPQVGGKYPAHQDASFLITEPVVAIGGAWLALHDADETNGCLEFIAGSHKIPVERKFVRNNNKVKPTDEVMVWVGPEKELGDDKSFIKVPVKAGSLVMLDGSVIHRSKDNDSQSARWAYTFHVMDATKASWSKENWISPDSSAFMPLY